MAIPKRIDFTHDYVFSSGAYLVSEVRQVNDFDRSTKENKIQQIDKDNGLPVWAVDVVARTPKPRARARPSL